MGFRDALLRETEASIATLERRLISGSDATEKRVISGVLAALCREQALAPQSELIATAQSLATIQAELEKAVGAARLGPFEGYLCALERHITRLDRLSGKLHAQAALPKATLHRPRGRAPKALPRRRVAGEPPSVPVQMTDSTKFDDLRDEYQRCYASCKARPEFRDTIDYYVKRLRTGRCTYELVQSAIGVPWTLVGVIHAMECGFNFSGHLHNGDPLTACTVHVPEGRPAGGTPPFTWLQSAIDALRLRKLDTVTDWSVPHLLFLLERYNGFGYRRHGIATPYLWSLSNLYTQGKFIQDGKFDPSAVSRQCGAALMLKEIVLA
jgi:lysozyme family protein